MGRIWSPVNGVTTKLVANQITRFREGLLPVNGCVFVPDRNLLLVVPPISNLLRPFHKVLAQSFLLRQSRQVLCTKDSRQNVFTACVSTDSLLSQPPTHVVAQRGGRGKVLDLAVGSIRTMKYSQAPPPAQVCAWFERNAACLRCTVGLKTIRFHVV